MKTIMVDAINTFIIKGKGINKELFNLLESYKNKKIILTNANDEQIEKFELTNLPYPLFTLKHNPEKSDPEYFKIFLKNNNLNPKEVIFFEHNENAVKSAESIGIKTHFYDKEKQDLIKLKEFFDKNLN